MTIDPRELASTLAEGKGSVAIGGDVTDSNITTHVHVGDQRIELTVETFRELARHIQQQLLPHRRCDLPAPRTGFHGRESEAGALLKSLQKGTGNQAITTIRGIGGIGKTELAAQKEDESFWPIAVIAHQGIEYRSLP